jgi:hypothetical protein
MTMSLQPAPARILAEIATGTLSSRLRILPFGPDASLVLNLPRG